MGGKATKAVSKKATRPLKNIFVEERAHKVIEKHQVQPKVAPRHPSTEKILQKMVDENPQIKEAIKKEDPSLIDRVNQLQLEVTEEMPKFTTKARPLPQNTGNVEDPMKAYEAPKRIPKGFITQAMLLDMFDKHNNEPVNFQSELLAKELDLNAQDVANVLHYFEKIDLQGLHKDTKKGDETIKAKSDKKSMDENSSNVGIENESVHDMKKTPS